MSRRDGKPPCVTPPSRPRRFAAFRYGDAGSLGEDFLALQAALRDFHRSHYVARRMQLWLQGPRSLEVLGELATRFATGLAPGEAPPPAPPLTLGEPPQQQLAVSSQPALWRCPLIALSDNVTRYCASFCWMKPPVA